MIRNFFFLFVGCFGGVMLSWPGIITNTGWECAKDIALNIESKPKDAESFIKDLERKLKLTSALSAKTLLKADNLGRMEKFRILGDTCFRI